MSGKPAAPSLSLRRPSAVRATSGAVDLNPRPEPSRADPPPPPARVDAPPPSPPPPAHVEPESLPEARIEPAAEAPRPIPRAVSREAERLSKEPESDFFVSIPKSKKTALKTHCVQHGITMRDWLLAVLDEKGIGTRSRT